MRIRSFLCLLLAGSMSLHAAYSVKNYSHLLGMPGFNDELLQLHFQLYEGYVKNVNAWQAKRDAAPPPDAPYIHGNLERRLSREFDGMRLHELYFENLGGNGANLNKNDPLYLMITNQFGSFEKWKQDFINTGLTRGIGWAILYYDPEQKRLFNIWVDEHVTGHLVTSKPLLVMDVYEHAYMTQYKLDKAKYIEAFFNNINWNTVSQRFKG